MFGTYCVCLQGLHSLSQGVDKVILIMWMMNSYVSCLGHVRVMLQMSQENLGVFKILLITGTLYEVSNLIVTS